MTGITARPSLAAAIALLQRAGLPSHLFAAGPTVLKTDYAKWMLEEPRVNFAISARGAAAGIQHLGIQVEDPGELEEVYARLQGAERPVLEEGSTTCCYAKSEKSWIDDPQGVKWETFLTKGESTVYGNDALSSVTESACCTPAVKSVQALAEGVCCTLAERSEAQERDAACCG